MAGKFVTDGIKVGGAGAVSKCRHCGEPLTAWNVDPALACRCPRCAECGGYVIAGKCEDYGCGIQANASAPRKS